MQVSTPSWTDEPHPLRLKAKGTQKGSVELVVLREMAGNPRRELSVLGFSFVLVVVVWPQCRIYFWVETVTVYTKWQPACTVHPTLSFSRVCQRGLHIPALEEFYIVRVRIIIMHLNLRNGQTTRSVPDLINHRIPTEMSVPKNMASCSIFSVAVYISQPPLQKIRANDLRKVWVIKHTFLRTQLLPAVSYRRH